MWAETNTAPARIDAAAPGRGLTVGLVLLVTMVAFEALAVATVLPVTVRELGHVSLYGWVFSAFMLANLVGTVWAGREADRWGPARPLTTGLVLFGGGLLAGGLAPTMFLLVLARVSQGAGAGAVAAVAFVIVGRAYPSEARPRMFALMSSAWVVPGLIGPAIAGAVAQAVSWRAVFLALVPGVAVVGGLTLSVVRRIGRPVPVAARTGPQHTDPEQGRAGGSGPEGSELTKDGPEGDTSEGSGPEVCGHRLGDALRLAAGAALLLSGLDSRNAVAAVLLVLAGLVVGLPGLRRLLPEGTGRARAGIPAAVLGRGLLTFAFFGTEAFLPLALTSLRRQSPGVAGLVLTAATLAWTSASWVNARWATAWGPRRCTVTGLCLLVAGVCGSSLAALSSAPVWSVPPLWALAGAGMGLAYPSSSLVVLDAAPGDEVGAATASLQLADGLGTALGAGVGGAAVAFTTAAGGGARPGIATIDAVAVAVLVTALVVAQRFPTRKARVDADLAGS